ncbi:MAG: hypothetical protein ABSE55_14780 [Terracidiphilus sp.]|jgi:hypothetical protein
MNRFWVCLLCAVSAVSLAQQPKPASPAQGNEVMIAAVSHDDSVLSGGIGSGHLMKPGKVGVEPIAWLTPSGEWKAIRCDENHPQECKRFEREYLSKPHTYTVVSADGRGATVQVEKMALDDECFGYGGQGTFSGASIAYAGVAAESVDPFISGEPARRLTEQEAMPIRNALAAVMGDKLDSTKELRVYSMQLGGQSVTVIQRAYQDYASKPQYSPNKSENFKFIFAIGTAKQNQFHLHYWKDNVEDENEQILGTIHLKSGRDFLITSISDPESQFFHIYGIRNGKLALIFSGGGGGC